MRHSTKIWTLFLVAFLATTALSLLLLDLMGPPAGSSPKKQAHVSTMAIVPLSPALAEIVSDLGLEDRIVAVTDNTRFPESLRNKTHVGGFLTPNLELIVRAAPDLVICRTAQSRLAKRLRSLGIRTLEVPDGSIADILASIRRIGNATGTIKRSKALTDRLQRQLHALQRGRVGLAGPRVLLVVGRADETLRAIYAAGPNTILGEIIQIAGGRNVVTSDLAAYPVVSAEFLEAAEPDIIVEISAPPTAMPKNLILASWQRLPSVAGGRTRVVVIQDESWLIPSPRILDAAKTLQRLLASLHSKPRPVP